MQMLTFLSGIKNYILIGAEPGARPFFHFDCICRTEMCEPESF